MTAATQRLHISMVTACLDQVKYVADALRSVLDQSTPPDEYIVIDGASRDGSLAAIQPFAPRLTRLISEPDGGQSDALNKGFRLARGKVLGWLNADDRLLPGALTLVRQEFAKGDVDVLCGACRYESPGGRVATLHVGDADLEHLDVYDPIHQPSCFFRRDWFERIGGLNTRLSFGMDWDLWLRLRRAGARFRCITNVLSVYRVTGVNKTSVGGARRNREMYELLLRHSPQHRLRTEIGYRVLWPLKRLRMQRPRWLCRAASDAARTAALLALGPVLGFDRVRCCTHPFS
ncbi:MAG: glycosyltransferase family 2 protein [Phycisphaerae bacterium]